MVFDVVGDGNYLALVDTHRYVSFVGEDWSQNDRLLEPHFIAQMQKRALLIWGTGFETDWRVEVRFGFSQQKAFREILGTLEISEGEAFLLNDDSLTMAAPYQDRCLPDNDCKLRRITVTPGAYDCRILQMVDPETYFRTTAADAEDRPPEFVIEITSAKHLQPAWSSVPRSTL